MNRTIFRRTAFTAFSGALLLQAGLASAAAPGPVGARIAVNGAEANPQIDPAVATGPDGNFIIVWQSQAGTNSSYRSILARRYSANGEVLDALPIELYKGSYSFSDNATPAVAVGATGDFVVTWTQPYDGATVGTAIYAQRLSAAGVKIGSAFGVDFEPAYNSQPSVAIDGQGRFLIAWKAERSNALTSVQAQRYNANGTRNGTRMILSPADQATQEHPSVGTNPQGNFVVVWDTAAGSQIRAQRFNADGTLRGAVVNVDGGGAARRPAVAVNPSSAFVVTWESKGSSSGYDIVARGVTAAGNIAGPRFAVSGVLPEDQTGAAISMDAKGGFVVSWDRGANGSSGIGAQRFNANGGLLDGAINVSNGGGGAERRPGIGLDADGDFVIAWHGTFNLGTGYDIVAQRYQGSRSVNLDLMQSDSKDPAPTRGALTYTINVSNFEAPESVTQNREIDAALGAATGVTVENLLPAGVTNVSTSGSNWTCTRPTGTVVCTYSQVLRAGTQASPLQIRLTTPDSNGVTLKNDASVKGNQLDDNTINNREVESTRLVTGA